METAETSNKALILSGGGRGAYHVGVYEYLFALLCFNTVRAILLPTAVPPLLIAALLWMAYEN